MSLNSLLHLHCAGVGTFLGSFGFWKVCCFSSFSCSFSTRELSFSLSWSFFSSCFSVLSSVFAGLSPLWSFCSQRTKTRLKMGIMGCKGHNAEWVWLIFWKWKATLQARCEPMWSSAYLIKCTVFHYLEWQVLVEWLFAEHWAVSDRRWRCGEVWCICCPCGLWCLCTVSAGD